MEFYTVRLYYYNGSSDLKNPEFMNPSSFLTGFLVLLLGVSPFAPFTALLSE